MSWWLLGALAIGTYLCRWAGLVVLQGRELPSRLEEVLRVAPAALIGGLVFSQTFTDAGGIAVDARVAGVALAAVLAARGSSLLTVLVAGVGVVAVLRSLGVG